MAEIIVRGQELEGDFFDADFMERYEKATVKMYEIATAGTEKKYDSVADAFRQQCEVARQYFDEIFGDGTSERLFGEKMNLKDHMEAIAELTDCAARSKKEVNDLTNKYTQRQKSFSQPQQFVTRKKH